LLHDQNGKLKVNTHTQTQNNSNLSKWGLPKKEEPKLLHLMIILYFHFMIITPFNKLIKAKSN